nr:putative RNA-dependent RNA polymerase [Picobirnavirus sp.]
MNLDDVLAKWSAYLSTRLANGSEYEKNVLSFDLSSASKWGPQGGHPRLEEVINDTVLPTFRRAQADSLLSVLADPKWEEAKAARLAELRALGINNLRPKSPMQVVKLIQSQNAERLASNSGFPSFSRRKKEGVWRLAVQDAETGKYQGYPAILLFRRYRGKLRMVWMYPFSTNITEACYYYPLFNSMLSKPELTEGFFSPWTGFEGVRKLVTETYEAKKRIAASDFSATDEHFTWKVTEQVGEVLAQLFQPAYRDGLLQSLHHMHEIGLLISPTQEISGMHGVSSGSMWTNFIETVFDWILAKYCELASHGAVQGLYAIGDDMAWTTTMPEDTFTHWLERIGINVGQEIKAEKTMLKPDKVKTLQRLFQPGYRQENSDLLRGVYPTIRALNSLVYPERMHNPKDWNYDMFATRVFMILENCVDHPLFKDFVNFVISGNPRLGTWVTQRDSKLDRIFEKSKTLTGLVPTYNQEKKDSKSISLSLA